MNNQVYWRQPGQTTRFTAVRCEDTLDAMKYFGNYSPEGHTILVCMPERGSCKPWITIPDGTIAIVTKNGEYLGQWEPGMHYCLPWTEAQYLVTQQNIAFNMPVSTCPTSDNIFVQIDVSVVLQVQKGVEYVYQLCMNVTELNQMLEAAITERVRAMVRTVPSRQVYGIRGEEHAKAMQEHLHGVMESRGINIKSVIITNVKLPADVAESLQEKTIFQFRNTLERKKQSFELRTINDKEELEILKSIRAEERKDEVERAELEQAGMQKEIEKVKATRQRLREEIKEQTIAKVNEINANTDVKYNEILAEANLIENDILAQARLEAAQIKAEADAYQMKAVTEAQRENAKLVSEAISLEGEAESRQLKGLKKKREHMQIMQRLDTLDSLTQNKSVVIFGDQGNNLMSSLESYRMVYNK